MTDTRNEGDALLLNGGRLLDGSGGAATENPALLVVGERIAAVGDDARARAQRLPPGILRRFDATGFTILPGLIDSHCHIGFGDATHREQFFFYTSPEHGALKAAYHARRVLRAGVTTICDPIGVGRVGVALRDAIASGMAEGPRVFTAGRALTTRVGTGYPNEMHPQEGLRASVFIDRPDDAIREIRRQANDGVDLIKVLGTAEWPAPAGKPGEEHALFSAHELSLIAAEAHRYGLKATIHARPADSVLDAVRAGMDWILHASFIDDAGIEAMLATGAAICPTLTMLVNGVELGAEVGMSAGFRDAARREIDAAAKNLDRARRAGIPFMCGSDSGFAITALGEWHARELAIFVELLGFRPEEAIAASTSIPARVLGLSEDIGTLAPGKLADILVIEGDPVADIRILQEQHRFRLLLKSGRPVDLDRVPERRPLRKENVRALSSGRAANPATHQH